MGVDGVQPGCAHTLLTSRDSHFAIDLVKNLKMSGIEVSRDLQK